MGKPHPTELRERVIAFVKEGNRPPRGGPEFPRFASLRQQHDDPSPVTRISCRGQAGPSAGRDKAFDSQGMDAGATVGP